MHIFEWQTAGTVRMWAVYTAHKKRVTVGRVSVCSCCTSIVSVCRWLERRWGARAQATVILWLIVLEGLVLPHHHHDVPPTSACPTTTNQYHRFENGFIFDISRGAKSVEGGTIQIFCPKNLATWTHNFHNILGCNKTQRAFLRCCETGNVIHIMLVLLPIDMMFVLFALPIEAKYMTIGTKACCCVSGCRLFYPIRLQIAATWTCTNYKPSILFRLM